MSRVHVRIHGLYSSTVHRRMQTKITKVQPATGSAVLWIQIEGGTLGEAPRLLRKSARVRYQGFFFGGGVPPHPSFEENISSPFRKLLIHSISVSGLLIAGVCLLSFLPFCARTLQCGKGRYMYGLVIDDEDAGFYTCLLQASKCCINKAENKTLPSSNQ